MNPQKREIMKKEELGIYIHIPFCAQKCFYCDFISYSNKHEDIKKQYIQALKKEIDIYDLTKYNVTTIYFGGGTPSFINSKYIVDIMEKLRSKLVNNETKFKDIEITIEVNPGTINENKLQDYKTSGINRLSIGLQSTNNKLLKQIGRIHTYEEFLNTYNLVKKVGFENINIDLMIGLPNQDIQDLKESLEKIISLDTNHISVYSLIIEEGTKIEKLLNENKLQLPEEELERQMYWYVKNKLELNGYKHYEISNFAKQDKESKHNLNCWEQKEYIGLGVAAHSYLNNTRYGNINEIEEYIKNINENKEEKNKNIEERQTNIDKQKEFMMIGFRKIDGIKISEFKQKFRENPIYIFRKELNELVNEKLIQIDLDNIRLTNKGIDFANLVFEEFI